MPNTENIQLRMTAQEADSVAYVLMTSLHSITMLDRERKDVHAAANVLFKQLGYGHTTDSQGNRIENPRPREIDETSKLFGEAVK